MTNNNETNIEDKNEQFNMSFIDISITLGISENEVKKIYNSALRKLKHPKYYKHFKNIINQDFNIIEDLEKYGEKIIKDY